MATNPTMPAQTTPPRPKKNHPTRNLQTTSNAFRKHAAQSLAVLNPRRTIDKESLDDDDLAGPLLFCLLFASSLVLVRAAASNPSCITHGGGGPPRSPQFWRGGSDAGGGGAAPDPQSGKLHFGYIYGVALIGCLGMYFLLNMMSDDGINGARTTSVLGYCLLPMTFLALASAVFSLQCVTRAHALRTWSRAPRSRVPRRKRAHGSHRTDLRSAWCWRLPRWAGARLRRPPCL